MNSCTLAASVSISGMAVLIESRCMRVSSDEYVETLLVSMWKPYFFLKKDVYLCRIESLHTYLCLIESLYDVLI